MADPLTIAIIATAVGGGLQVASTVQQGQAAKAQGEFQEKIAFRNAELQEEQAEGQRQAAAEAAANQDRIGREGKARARAIQAKSGTAVGRGSNLATIIQIAKDSEADKLTIRREGAIRASSLRSQAGITRAQGSAAVSRGRATQRASVLSAIGTGASTAGQVGLASSLRSRPDRTIPSRASFGIR